MRYIVLTIQLFAFSFGFSQSTLSVFNNGGQQFYVILNGIKQNSIPQTNVSVSGIKNGPYSVKVIFADGKTHDIDKNFFIEEPSFITTRVVFKKGKGKLQLMGMEPVGSQAAPTNAVTYRPDEQTIFSDAPVISQSTQQTTNQTVTQTGQTSAPQNGSVGFNMNVSVQDPTLNNGQGGMNVSVNMNGTGTQTQQTSSQSVQTTTVTTSTNVNGTNLNQVNTQGQPSTTTATSVQSIKCVNILADEQKEIAVLKKLTFEEDRKEQLIKDVSDYCMTASQAYKLIEIFTFESDRLELAKYLYLRVIDKDVAQTKFLDLFTFDSNKVEFRDYCRTVK